VVDLDPVGGHAGRVDEGDDQRGPATREDRVQLEAAESACEIERRPVA